jgi:hypothetical protein
MVVIRSEGKFLAPIALCDVCGEQVRGSGSMWTLAPADGAARLGEAFFSHTDCASSFLAQSPEPPGWRWARANIQELLDLLVDNTRGNPAEKPPVVLKSRLH